MEKIELMAITDELTGLINRRHMMYMLKRAETARESPATGFANG